MLPSSPQLAPQNCPGGRSQIVAVGPPAAGTFLILLSGVQKAIHAPSGEKNGACAPSVPAIGAAVARSSSRRYTWVTPAWMPAKTTRRPSGEIDRAVREGRVSEFWLGVI